MNFKIGQKVIALTNPLNSFSQFRVKGKIYIVKDIMYCCKTGMQSINIGGKANSNRTRCECGELHENKGLGWTHSKYFASVEEKGEMMIEFLIEEITI